MNVLVEISNLFNLITRSHNTLQSYHFGWRSDVNFTVTNNFNSGTGNDLGKQYPAVHLVAAPRGTMNLAGDMDIECMVFIDILQDSNNDGNRVTLTLVEQFNEALKLGQEVLLVFKKESKNLIPKGQAYQIREETIRWSTDSNTHNDQLVSAIFEFTIFAKVPCNPPNIDIELVSGLIPEQDIERV